ncbi:hypothetical protein [Alkalihalobacillus sp. LMS39]|uniref:hypothetical protein n=1 Tax=Alkalihalobacillus sp. LMS39 TaxID=2924032 RepID=UPI001FB447E9|nr:hypothetical protein [Alkalihalobacillus sp. LMS39]UOE92108.1 hypothetical protein MM271_12620 [Alkalihalobacillus sp. LMS39]
MWLTVKEKQYLAHLLSKQKKKLFLSKQEKETIHTLQQKFKQTTANQTVNEIKKPKL